MGLSSRAAGAVAMFLACEEEIEWGQKNKCLALALPHTPTSGTTDPAIFFTLASKQNVAGKEFFWLKARCTSVLFPPSSLLELIPKNHHICAGNI
jgi:hypothetical protein